MSNQMNNILLRIDGVTKWYGDTLAVNNVSFELENKGFVVINGISGSGKTTLMNVISGLDSPTSGAVYYDGKNITELRSSDLDEYRNSEIGIVFQNFNLIDELSVEENLMLPLMLQTITEEKKALVDEVLNFVGLRGYEKRKGYELSAGQKQRVAIARAIIKRPKVIFADEATGNLDAKNTEQILRLFDSISKKCLVVLISHSYILAKKYADRIITLDEGKICEDIDNRQMKELYLEAYKISITGENFNQEMPLENFDIKSVIKDFIDKSGKKFDTYSFNTKITKEDRGNKKHNWSELKHKKVRNMPFVALLKSVLRSIKKNKLRFFLISCLFAFMTLLFFLIVSIKTNDYYMSLSRYVNSDDKTLYDVKKVISSDDGKCDIQRGEGIYTQLTNLLGTNNVVECIGEMSFEGEVNRFYVAAFKLSTFFESVDIIGVWPKAANEIAINKDMATEENIKIGSQLLSEEKTYKVVGIFDPKSIIEDNCVVVSKNINDELLKYSDIVALQSCNILKSVKLDEYVSEIATIGKASNVQSEDLIWGRMPETDSEVLISMSMLEENEIFIEEGFVTKYRLYNLYDKKYNGQYEHFVNLYDYLGKNVEIVGVFNVDNAYEVGEILVRDAIYSDILDFYDKYLNYEMLYVNLYTDKDNYELIKMMKNSNIYLCDNICAYIYAIQDFLNDMESVLEMLFILMLVMLVFVIISFLSYNVKAYSRTVGIYKSLGIKNMDIVKIFFVENMIITVFSMILANLGLHGIINFMNEQIFAVLEMPYYEIFILRKKTCVLINILVIFISAVATVVPVSNMVKKESVILINREE